MMTIIPRGLTVIPGGCRYKVYGGTFIERLCDHCATEGKTCEFELEARSLAIIAARQPASSGLQIKTSID